ncbi:MAG: hypothetical protein J0I57_16115 [Hyphomicrobium sp.]|nr:hypothetical protein [Hyphomicrobium sp.]ODT26958.1 MAG: hypothetical protein ABS54_06575 [Hyphomicrobium sp. SCN 65-11]
MDLDRFKECSAAFGAERRRWPPREHTLYDRFALTPEGMAILADAERTDLFLDALEPAEPDPRRVRDITAIVRPAWQRMAKPAAALAASALLGFALGYMQALSASDAGMASGLLLGPQSLQEFGL